MATDIKLYALNPSYGLSNGIDSNFGWVGAIASHSSKTLIRPPEAVQ
jgi:hypothetical protein